MHRYKLKKKTSHFDSFGSSNVNVTEHLFEKQNCYFFFNFTTISICLEYVEKSILKWLENELTKAIRPLHHIFLSQCSNSITSRLDVMSSVNVPYQYHKNIKIRHRKRLPGAISVIRISRYRICRIHSHQPEKPTSCCDR